MVHPCEPIQRNDVCAVLMTVGTWTPHLPNYIQTHAVLRFLAGLQVYSTGLCKAPQSERLCRYPGKCRGSHNTNHQGNGCCQHTGYVQRIQVLRSTVSKSVSVGSLSFTSTLQSSCPLLQANFREPCSHCHCCLLSRSLAAQKIQRTEEKALCSHQDPGVYQVS